MNSAYTVSALTQEEIDLLQRIYSDLMILSSCSVPSVRAAARAAVAHVVQALNGQGLAYELYTRDWVD